MALSILPMSTHGSGHTRLPASLAAAGSTRRSECSSPCSLRSSAPGRRGASRAVAAVNEGTIVRDLATTGAGDQDASGARVVGSDGRSSLAPRGAPEVRTGRLESVAGQLVSLSAASSGLLNSPVSPRLSAAARAVGLCAEAADVPDLFERAIFELGAVAQRSLYHLADGDEALR